ncbi:MAG TPA: NADH-quinone oxidoreductase subunit N [Solirubrobacteraceae bacterium]|nr:NADH-quinone oxidoreductase subunit N [Solirubrobacteraceae bacterium]
MIHGPAIDYAGLSPFIALAAGGIVVLMIGLFRPAVIRARVVPALTVVTLGTALGLEIGFFHHHASIISGALEIDGLALVLDMVFAVAALAAVFLSVGSRAPEQSGHGEYHSLLIFSVLGMAVLVSAQDLVTLFLGIELLSIPLYVLCASEYRREGSLESGLKYLVIGSVGSASLVYGLALVYGATGSTGFSHIAAAVSRSHLHGGVLGDPMVLTGIALVIVGFAFKASVAPFHQWTPDVYEGAPTAITAFMATATKAAALGVFLRFFDVAVFGEHHTWAPMLAALAAVTIVIGNVGALGQSSLKRMLGYSGVAQAGYMLGGVVVASRLGVEATVLYITIYLGMNLAAFAVIGVVERDDRRGDNIASLGGLGSRRPWLAWSMTIAMLSLAGIPGTAGFIGKFQLIHALVDGKYLWLAIVLVIGSMISLGYYLRVVAAMWMGSYGPARAQVAAAPEGALPPIAGGSQEADAGGADDARDGEPETAPVAHQRGPSWLPPYPTLVFVAVLFAAATVFFGIVPQPLFHLAAHAGRALAGLP